MININKYMNVFLGLNSSFILDTCKNLVLFKRKTFFSDDLQDNFLVTLNNLMREVLKTRYLINRLNRIYLLYCYIHKNVDYIKRRFKNKKFFLNILLNKTNTMISECIELERELGCFFELKNCQNILLSVLSSLEKKSRLTKN